MEMREDINNNYLQIPITSPRSRPANFLEKKVRFPTLEELGRTNVPPYDITPLGSLTEINGNKGILDATTSSDQFDHQVYTPPPLPPRAIEENTRRFINQKFHAYYHQINSKTNKKNNDGKLDIPPSSRFIPLDECKRTKGLPSSPQAKENVFKLNRQESNVSSTQATIFSSTEKFIPLEKRRVIKRRYPSSPGKGFQPNTINFNLPRLNNTSWAPPSSTEYPSDLNSSGVRISSQLLSENGQMTASTIPSSMRIKQFPHLTSVLSELKAKKMVFDRATAIVALKGRILRGEKVTYEEIQAIKSLSLPIHQKHLGWRLPWSTDLYCSKGLVHFPTPNKPLPENGNTFGVLEDLRLAGEEEDLKPDYYGRRRYVLNLGGFKDSEISLYLEGKNKLVLRAVREENEEERIPATIATETIMLPSDLPADNLRIVRKPSGTTIIEESWRF